LIEIFYSALMAGILGVAVIVSYVVPVTFGKKK